MIDRRNNLMEKYCKFCSSEMKMLYDDGDSFECECVECGSIRYWEDSPAGFADYWENKKDK